jgi:hypothetical protein
MVGNEIKRKTPSSVVEMIFWLYHADTVTVLDRPAVGTCLRRVRRD